MQDAFVEFDDDGLITDWNRAAELLFGWSRDEVLGRRLHDTIFAEELREALTAAVHDFTSTGRRRLTGRRIELPAVDRAGLEFAAELSITPLRVRDDWRFAAFVRDAGARPSRQVVEEEGALRHTERVARLGSWQWVPLTGEMRFSDELCRLIGEDPRTYRPNLRPQLDRVHPDDRRRVGGLLDDACREHDEFEIEYRIVRPDGEERWVQTRGTIIRDASGTPLRSMGTTQDVTERVQAEARNRRLAALVQSTDDAVITADREGRITSWNEGAERLYGYPAHEAIGQPIGLIVPPARAGEERMLLASVMAGEGVRRLETQHLAADARVIDVGLTLSPVRDDDGRIVEASGIVRDITDRKRAERERERYVADLESLARRDALTGLLTRRELQGVLDRELSGARSRSECSLLLIDVDDLGAVNERLGRDAGDDLLRDLAAVVREAAADFAACRLADDEIAIVLPDVGAGPAMALAQRIKAAWGERPRAARISAGVATWPEDGTDKEELFERAFAAVGFDKPERAAEKGRDPLGEDAEDDAIEQVLGLLRRHLGMEVAYLSEFASGDQAIRTIDAAPERPLIRPGDCIPVGDTYCRLMVDGELPHVIADTRANPVTAALEVTDAASIGSYVGVPVRLSDGTLYGSLCSASRAPRPDLGAQAMHFALVCARLVGDLVEQRALETHNRRLQAELTGVRALLAALDARDHYTGAHSEAVVSLAVAVAQRMDLPPAALAAVEQVALLHDIGKIGVPDSILQKPGPLDASEWELMREHPAIGARIVQSITSLDHLAPAIRAEHERWDGRGYPDGLEGEAIPLASRIILACDALHAMTSDRPYRKAMALVDAEAELRRNAGTQFDPAVVEALLAELTPEDGEASHLDARQAPASSRPSVLVVEDNAAFRLALEAGLDSEGFDVKAVGDAAEAYRCARQVAPDLVLLDWILPGGDGGAAACRRLRQLCPDAKVVIFTGLGDVRDRRAAREAGADQFLQKGMPLPALVEHLQLVLTPSR